MAPSTFSSATSVVRSVVLSPMASMESVIRPSCALASSIVRKIARSLATGERVGETEAVLVPLEQRMHGACIRLCGEVADVLAHVHRVDRRLCTGSQQHGSRDRRNLDRKSVV